MTQTLSSPPTHFDTGPCYVRNLCALWRTAAPLAQAIEAIHPDDVPKIEHARDGACTLKCGPAGVYLHSRYAPLKEADAWAQKQLERPAKCGERYAVVICGFGLGYHIRALFDRLPADAVLVAAENNLPLLKAAMEHVDMADMLASGRLMIFTSLDRGAAVERLEPRSVLFTAGAGTLLLEHSPSRQAHADDPADFYRAFQKLITEFIAFTRTGLITLMLNNVATCRNIANNLGRYATTAPIDTMRDAFKGRPAILVAAGPSLAKNMHLLKTLQGNDQRETRNDETGIQRSAFNLQRSAVIIAVQTMLKPLLAAGIEPDFVTSLDYNTVSTRFFENLEESGGTGHVHLVAQPTANWNVLDVFPGSLSLTGHDFADWLLNARTAAPPKRATLKPGATVAHLSFYLAEFLGCHPIILIGQDLGFVDGLYYKPGTAIHETWGVELGRFNTLETKEWERIVRSRTILRKIPDIHGHPMYTEEQFFVYLQQFERDFAASRARIIDATEGGAHKQHVERMTLQEAMQQFCAPPPDHSPAAPAPIWKAPLKNPWTHLESAIESLAAREAQVETMRITCEKTIPLLKDMLAHQSDPDRMQRLFVEVDRLRSSVDPATFEMVTHLNTVGEMRRHQTDLLVKAATRDAAESHAERLSHQKRQLTRDIEYVGDLKIGCERLLEILTEARTRVVKQRDALHAGFPWPREVAGGAK